jgi:glycogen operon protein
VSYNGKHNDANGEYNNDGTNDNDSWNCGAEGWTEDPGINALRSRQMRNAIAMLMVSQGVPMLLMGDELGRSQNGNNNTYCHDNELNWLNWDLLNTNRDLFNFVSHCINFRKAHPVFRNRYHLQNRDYVGSGYADITWHGVRAWDADWSESSRVLAFMLCGKHAKNGAIADNHIYVAMNMHWETQWFETPGLPPGMKWHVSVNTGSAPEFFVIGSEPELEHQHGLLMRDRSVAILVGK